MEPAAYLPAPAQNKNLRDNLRYEEKFELAQGTGFAEQIRHALLEIGVPARNHPSTQEGTPPEIARLQCLQGFPTKGFGLIGPPGCGKSCAFVVALRRTLKAELTEAGPNRWEDGKFIEARRWTEFKWVGWPAMAIRMKGLAARREWLVPEASTAGLIQWLATDQECRRVLVLDDLGMETLKADSYTTEQLELLIDEAYGLGTARVFWTSNKLVEDLEQPTAYGPRLMSRLLGLSPDHTLPSDMPDLRIGVHP
jgi:DNA replication protein DnaC